MNCLGDCLWGNLLAQHQSALSVLNKTGKVEALFEQNRDAFPSPLRGLLPPMAGRLPEGALKMPGEVRLVGEPGRQRDLGQGQPVALRGNQPPGVAQPTLH